MADTITKKDLVAAICKFFTEKENNSNYTLAQKMDVDKKQIPRWINQEVNVQQGTYKKIVAFVDNQINATVESKRTDYDNTFCGFLIDYLESSGFSRAAVASILTEHPEEPMSKRLDRLMSKEYAPADTINLSNGLKPNAVISRLQARMTAYSDYYQINDQHVDVPQDFTRYLESKFDPKDSSIILERNYLVLTFPDGYQVLLVVVPEIQDSAVSSYAFFDSLKQFMQDNQFGMIIFFTDQNKRNNISFKTQFDLLNERNVFFEYISDKEVQSTALPNLTLHQTLGNRVTLNAWVYAEIIMERLGTYYSIIRNEVIFNHKRPNEVQDAGAYEDFTTFLNTTFLKNTFHYAYFARHAIYFERELVRQKARNLINARVDDYKKNCEASGDNIVVPESAKKLDLVIELCAPNSFVSASLTRYAKRIMLFTSSKKAHERMDAEFKNFKDEFHRRYPHSKGKKYLDNVEFHLNHPNPEFITKSSKVQQHSADMVIIGFGMGSNLNDLKEYLRWINLWLKDDGLIFISFLNSESILLKKSSLILHSLERQPLVNSTFWHYETIPGLNFLIRTKCYDKNQVKRELSTFVEAESCTSYPYLLGLTDHIHNPEIQDTIRDQDKHYAMNGGPKKDIFEGHYLHVVGAKNSNVNSKAQREKRHQMILDYLREESVKFEEYPHSDTVDTNNLYKTLLEESGMDSNKFHLLKLVILMSKGNKEPLQNKELLYCILPREKDVNYNNEKFVPFNEQPIIRHLGHGTITPFLCIPKISEDVAKCLPENGTTSTTTTLNGFKNWKKKVCLIGFEELGKEYVVVSSGISTKSLRIRKEAFLGLFNRMDINLVKEEILQ